MSLDNLRRCYCCITAVVYHFVGRVVGQPRRFLFKFPFKNRRRCYVSYARSFIFIFHQRATWKPSRTNASSMPRVDVFIVILSYYSSYTYVQSPALSFEEINFTTVARNPAFNSLALFKRILKTFVRSYSRFCRMKIQ